MVGAVREAEARAKMRRALAVVLILLALLLHGYSSALANLLAFSAVTLLSREAYKVLLQALYGGCPLPRLRCLRNVCYSESEETCVYLGFRVTDCKHGCYDLDAKEYWGRSLVFFSTALTTESEYILIVTEGSLFLVSKSCDRDANALLERAARAREALLRGFGLIGCEARQLNSDELQRLLRPGFLEVVLPNRVRMALAILAVITMVILYVPLLPILLLLMLALTRNALGKKSEIHRVKLEGYTVYALRNSTVTFTYPSIREVYARGRVFYTLVPAIKLLALRLRPAPWDIAATLDSNAYRIYEFGTALDKLSLLHKSQKYFFASRRRWERREPVFLASGLLVAREDVRETLEKLGLHFTRDLLALKALE